MLFDTEQTLHGKIHHNLTTNQLLEQALLRGKGKRAANGALAVVTGSRTGRSPKDRFIVKDKLTEDYVNWGPINQAISAERFESLWYMAK